MSKDIRHLARVWFEEVWNNGRAEGGADVAGVPAFKVLQRQFLTAFPDLKIQVEDVITEGDKTTIRFTCTGTHQGDMFGAPPSGRPARFTGMSIARWRNGRIVEGWNNVDFHSMMQQIT